MEVVDPGHIYILDYLDVNFDGRRHKSFEDTLTFVKREGDKYPGNVGHHPGTITQEVLRALIDRTKYVNKQLPCAENEYVLHSLRTAILFLEQRAHRMRGKELLYIGPGDIEDIPTCDICGHILCEEKHDE